MEFDEDIDARGLICPLPVLKARKRLLAMAPGRVLRLRATDPAAVVDVPHFCREAGHQFLTDTPDGDGMAYFIRRGDGPAGEG
ncbi:MAG: sulfurtransferase TusA family protein [Defluviimonas denitrificans]|jgi:tRNA 2-thiouridine synthesizing protein A